MKPVANRPLRSMVALPAAGVNMSWLAPGCPATPELISRPCACPTHNL